jgi:2-(1,2-epoxy-1,2-dihydrophenyl)acetyl-CoA isomerase
MAFRALTFHERERVAHVTLNRPERLNALNGELVAELRAAAERIASDPRIRAVLLTAAGRAFSSGADLMGEDFINTPGRTLGELVGASLREQFNPMVSAWYDLKVPVVVAVNGIAAGAGVSLALVGDIVLAAHSATFVQLFAPRLGLMPDLGSSFHVPRLVGVARAKGLALLGEALPAAEAERWGLIWRCVEDEQLMPQAESLVRRLAVGPTQAFARIKRVFNDQPANRLSDQLAIEASLQEQLGDTQDFAEGVQAFRGKRPPRFSGE